MDAFFIIVLQLYFSSQSRKLKHQKVWIVYSGLAATVLIPAYDKLIAKNQ